MTISAMPPLRPLRVGEILDRALRIYRRHFLQFVGIIALVQVPLVGVQLLASLLAFGNTFTRLEEMFANPATAPSNPFAAFGPEYFAGASLNSLVAILSFILVQGLATAALTKAVADSYLGEQPAHSIVEAYRRVKESWLSVVGALLLAVVLGIGLLIWWIVPCFGWLTGGGMLLYLWRVVIPLLAPIIILEKQPAASAWRRAWDLARRRFWWVLGFALLLYLFNLLVVAGPAALVGALSQFLVGNPLRPDAGTFRVQAVAQSLTTLVTSLLYLPIQAASMTLLYVDLRVRTEGLDLALLAQQEEEKIDVVSGSALPAGRGDLVTGSELANFLLITVGIIVAIIALYALLLGIVFVLFSLFGGV
jgi:hypothetical protein